MTNWSDGRYVLDRQMWATPLPDVSDMRYPARCTRCSRVYDLARVEVTGHYADCSMWRCPGCKVTVSDRVGMADHHYVELDAEGREKR